MNPQSRDTVTFLLTTLTTLLVLAGLIVRFVLMPYLREHLIAPVKETHTQVTENGHVRQHPTLPDRLHALSTDVHTLTRVLDGHVEWSANEHERLDAAIEQLRKEDDPE